MIKTIQDQMTLDLFNGVQSKASRKLPVKLQRKAYLMLQLLNAAIEPSVMATPPGNHLHKLTGNLESFWAVSINQQYRIIFKFQDGDAYQVKVIDYH